MSDSFSISPTSRGWNVVLTVGGEKVSGLAIVDKRVRVGRAGLKMAGIAGLWTNEAHRKKGYATRVMWAAIEEMARRRYDVSILFGIDDFYHRYKYVVCFASPVCQVSTDGLPGTALAGFKVRTAKPKDLSRIVDLYRMSNADRSASTLRGKGWTPVHGQLPGWRMPRMARDVERRPGKAIVAEDLTGKIVAYAAYDTQNGHCMITEVGASTRAAYPVLAHRIRRLAIGSDAERVRLCLPVDDPFGEYLGRFGCGWSVIFPENSGSMGRVVSLATTIQKLLPTFENRLDSGKVKLPKEGIRIETDIGAANLKMTKGGLALSDDGSGGPIVITQMNFTQLMFGYRSVDDLMIDGEIQLAKKLIPVISTLFPKSNPYMWWGDRF